MAELLIGSTILCAGLVLAHPLVQHIRFVREWNRFVKEEQQRKC